MVVRAPSETKYHVFTVDDYHRMIDLGILTPRHHVVLMRGEVVMKSDYRSPHLLGTTALERYRFTPDEYQRLIAAGLLGEHDRVELSNGTGIETMGIGNVHAACVDVAYETLSARVGTRAKVRSQNPIVLASSEPEPDVSIVHRREDNYRSGKPRAADTILLVEVADTSLAVDLGPVATQYANNNIREYWVIDANAGIVHVHRDPQADGTWAAVTTHGRGGTLTVAALPTVTVGVSDILP